MEELLDIGIPTTIACLGVYLIVYLLNFICNKIWSNTCNRKVRLAIKWTWSMWLPIWPIIIGGSGGLIKGLPIPEVVENLGHVPGYVSVVYGSFCGMISMAVVKAIKQALEKKGIDVDIQDLKVAKADAKKEVAEKNC